MASSYYPITTDNYFDNTQSQSINSYQMTNKTKTNNYHDTASDDDDDDDNDLDELRKAALKTLYSNKRKSTHDQSPIIHRNSRSSSRSSSSRSYSSSISSNSLDKNDKDYRFQTKEKSNNGDIDERFPQNIPNDDDNDALIVNCPLQDDDLFINQPHPPTSSKTISKEKHKKSPPKKQTDEHPISITVKLNSEEFDLRQLIKKRRTNDDTLPNNQRTVHILPKDEHRHSESRRLDKYQKH